MYRLLIVDDEPLVLEQLHMLIDGAGWNAEIVSQCEYGRQALEEIPRAYPDILITDISMPDMDGLTLIAQCRERRFGIGAFLVLTAYQSFAYARTAMQEGVISYLLKPVDRSELKKALDEAIAAVELTRREECLRNYAPPSGLTPVSMIERFYGEPVAPDQISFTLLPQQAELLNQLVKKMDEMDETAAETAAERFFSCCREARLAPSVVSLSVIGACSGAIRKNGWEELADRDAPERAMQQDMTLEELRAFLLSFIRGTVQALRRARLNQRSAALQVKEYIDTHYTEKIGLQELAGQFYLNPVYLGQCFYKAVGEYLHVYISRKRIEKAQELIRQGYSVQRASELVGYDNYTTFKMNFIRVAGMRPGEFKNQASDEKKE